VNSQTLSYTSRVNKAGVMRNCPHFTSKGVVGLEAIVSSRERPLGEDEDWLCEVAGEMEIEDGVIWVYGIGQDGILAFTDFGIESLIELVRMCKENPTWLKRCPLPQ
jgi:hypothetical protein